MIKTKIFFENRVSPSSSIRVDNCLLLFSWDYGAVTRKENERTHKHKETLSGHGRIHAKNLVRTKSISIGCPGNSKSFHRA